jgi:hypothetical protein
MNIKRLKALSKIDTEHITEADVKSILGCWFIWSARAVIKTLVRRGEFIANPDGTYAFVLLWVASSTG